jgi:hypothetical protein
VKRALASAALAALTPFAAGQELASLLRRAPGDLRGHEALVLDLARLAGEQRAELVRLALGTGLDELLASGEAEQWVVAPEALPAIAGEALARLPGRATCEVLARELGEAPEAPRRRAALRLLAVLESSSCSSLTWSLVRTLDPLALGSPVQRSEALAALTTAFRIDGASAEAAACELAELELAPAGLVLAALAASGRSEHAAEVEACLDEPGNPLFVPALAALVELERRAPFELEGRARAAYASSAPWMQAGERAEHLHTLAASEDPELVPLVLELAGEADARIQRLVRAALQELARSNPPEAPAEWSDWHARELAWFHQRFEPVLAEFAGEDPAVAVRALHECLRHPLFRRASAGRLAALLIDARAEAALAALPALAAWGSWAAVPGLELALDAESKEVRALAAETLALLTGTKLALPD